MWILYAFGSALFCWDNFNTSKNVEIKKTDSHVATALRTIIVAYLFMANGFHCSKPKSNFNNFK